MCTHTKGANVQKIKIKNLSFGHGAGVEVEQSFIFSLVAMLPQYGRKRQRQQSFYVKIDSLVKIYLEKIGKNVILNFCLCMDHVFLGVSAIVNAAESSFKNI